MAQYWLNVAILRIILPATFTACVIWRPTGLSLIYLILAIISPFIPIPTPITLRKSTGVYFKICIAVSVIALLAQVSFQIVLLSIPSIFDEFRQSCTLLEKIFRHVGLVQLDHATPFMIFFWWLPEMITLPITSIMYYVCRHTTVEPTQEDPENFNLHQSRLSLRKTADANAKIVNFLGKIGTYIVLISLCYTASLSPSVEAGLYFIIFLSAATWWACYKELTRGFAAICRIVMFIVIFHILVLMIYQNQWPQEFIPDRSSWARYFALQSYYTTNCTDPRDVAFTWKGTEWIGYAYALRLFWLYYVLALQSQFLFRKPKSADASVTQPNERTPLMKFSSGRSGIIQDSTGSVIVQDGQQEEGIQMQTVNEDDTENSGGAIEQVFMAVFSIFQLIGNSSYLATNILMMAWSIMYHSWTTFVFLLWALILWMAPNKRSFMMKCSPLIVVYGTILLIVGFIYSMDLTENELPSSIYNVSMAEIGFPKSSDISRWHLIVKCGFMTMFWITMRQYMAERQQQRNISVLRDIVAPVHVSVSAATTIPNNTQTEIKSKFMRDVGMLVKKLLTKLWIVVVAIMLFASGITGERMTVFRIIYMTLFLFFVISFQISWSAWRKMMYGFWITVIGYSVIMLILVYTYQFPKFPIYWKYLHINEKLQQDIGLEAYQTKDLFVRLLTPTFFVIITVLQIHYFHDDFLETTNMENITVRAVSKKDKSGRSTSVPGETSMADVLLSEDDDYSANSPKYTLKQLKYMSKMERITFLRRTLRQIRSFYNYVWLFLEIHIQKIIFISLFLLCIDDVCAINLIFLTIVVIMINFKRSIQLVAINSMAVAIAFLVVTKMLYQITYINHSVGDQNCTIEKLTENGTEYHIKTYNIAEWIGLTKAPTGKLAFLLKDYIGIVIVTTIRGVIMVRQCFHRYSRGEPLDTPQLMFPAITRADADKGIAECLKFFLDYGFYKFGVEFCLMCIVALIGTRLDVYSVIYAVWLVIIFSPTRRTIAKIWPFFQVFMIILIPIQYAFVIGPPTWLCINYPWYTSQYLEKLQEWMYLPDAESPPNAQKLICDFILLFMVVRQNLVFKIETKCTNEGSEFIAGHNYSVHRDFDKPNFVNPVKDYVSHVHSWLDIVKRGTMMSFFWITLSIMFLAGTKRTTLFSLGYLVGAFIFLWQGSDFYLRPVNVILKWWNLLIGYNVIVILCKALLQGVGCVLMEKLQTEVCWLTQLLGISCLTMPAPSTPETNPLFDCQVEVQDIGMVWDGLCFACLIIQKRLFKTYYFFHIIDETKAMSILASRGGELLENIHRKRIEVQENIEKNILQKIKLKMDKIKADQQRIQGPSYREPTDHKVDSLYPRDRPLYRQRAPKTNREAIRSGDYYMFDDFDDDDTTNIVPELDMEVDEDDLRRQRQTSRRMTVSELMTTVLKTDIDIATHVAMYGGTTKDALRMRRQSVPLSRKKSSMSYLSARSESPDETDVMDDTSPKKSRSEKSDPTDSTTAPADDKDSPLDDDKASTITGSDRKKKISLMIYFTFLLQFINSFIVSATKYINKFSRDYRQIRKTLAKEKEELKAKPDFRVGTRLGINQIWQPIPIVKESEILSAQRDESIEPELSEVDQPPIIQLAASVWFGILAHSTFMCYFMIFLHQIKNHSILSTPLPLMVFCWGSLTIPRPSKTFWVTIIAYTEAIVIVKCICQLDIIPWVGELGKKPLDVQSILGVEQDSNYALWDLLLLLVVFFHRFMLKSMGQWSTPSYTRKIIPENPPGQLSRRNSHEEPTRFTLINENNRRTTSQNLSTSIAPPPPPVESETNATSARDVDGDEEPLVEVKIIETNVCNQKLSSAVTMTAKKYLSPSKAFFDDLLNPDGKEKTNVYAYMFLCDFFNFLLIIFKFQSFGPQQDDDDDVTVYLQENRVPILFLIMMLVQFALIVIDRALYLRKSILGKLGFHYCLIFFVHIWMFFVLLYMTERAFDATLAPQIWYMIKCFYLLLAAYQLRLGYPTRILGNFLCKNYNIINYCLFKVFMLVPFLFELRALMDWIWTDTSMTMMDWFKMEDIFANVYQLKCMRGLETNYPQPRGVKKTQSSKYLVGGGMLLFIIGLIWFPLLFFALGRRAGDPNLPYDVTLTIKIGAHEPIYMMSAENESIIKYSIDEYKVMKNVYNLDKAALNFLQGYEPADVAAVRLGRSSQKIWAISPPDREKLRDDIDSNVSLPIHVIWSVSRKTDVKDSSGTTTKQRDISLPAYVNGEFNPVRKSLVALLTNNIDNGTIPTATILLENVFPKFLKVTSRTTSLVKELMDKTPKSQIDTQDLDKYLYRNVILHLSAEAGQQWWSVQESCDDTFYKNYLSRIELNSCNYIMMFLFNDKALPPTLSFISGFGILGLYTTAVILASQMIRRAFSEMAPKIMFDDMPYVDRILRLCLDIYLVRENKELALEEDLFAKLIFLYRSPETLIRWTRPPEPNEDDRDGDDDTRNDDEGGESSGLRQRVLSD